MTNVISAAGRPAANPSVRSPASWGGGWAAPVGERTLERERLEDRARRVDATAQLQRCFPHWTRALEHLTARALDRLARNEPVDPNDAEIWRSRDAHAQAVLHRHGLGRASAARLTSSAITALIDGQAQADRDAGLDWSSVTVPARVLDGRLARAHERLPIALEDPAVWAYPLDQRRALAGRLGFEERRADDLSRWVLAHPGEFDADDLRCWRIGSDSWLALAGEQLAAVEKVERPVGVFVVPARSTCDGWQLMPVLALETIRLVVELGGRLDRDLRSVVVPIASREELLERINIHTLHASPRECLDAAGQLSQELSRQLGVPVSPGVPRDKRDRWGRIAVHRRSYKGADGTTTAELELRVLTFPARGFSQRRLGSAPREQQYAHPSAVMDLGEAVQTAIDVGLPLLLSTEAAGELKDTVRVGRMKGRPGMLTITSLRKRSRDRRIPVSASKQGGAAVAPKDPQFATSGSRLGRPGGRGWPLSAPSSCSAGGARAQRRAPVRRPAFGARDVSCPNSPLPCSSPPAGRAASPTDRRPDRSGQEPRFPKFGGRAGHLWPALLRAHSRGATGRNRPRGKTWVSPDASLAPWSTVGSSGGTGRQARFGAIAG